MPEVQESGHIYFFYRPRVQREEAEGLDEIQRFHIVLSPRGKRVWRLLTVGRKRLPGAAEHERVWAFVERVARRPEGVEDLLDRHHYETKTRGERLQAEARPAGEGVYRIVRHPRHTHLAYSLEFPEAPGDVQHELRIQPKASYVVAVKNPETPSPPQAGFASREDLFPDALQDRFRGRRFAELDADFLDQEGTELILIGASTAPEQELHIELPREEESEAEAAIFRDLKLEREQHPLVPLFEGAWR